MAIGERIHFFRTMRGMTQKYLGMALGFPEKSADVRLAQYENGSRTPKADVTAALAKVLDTSDEIKPAATEEQIGNQESVLDFTLPSHAVHSGRPLRS